MSSSGRYPKSKPARRSSTGKRPSPATGPVSRAPAATRRSDQPRPRRSSSPVKTRVAIGLGLAVVLAVAALIASGAFAQPKVKAPHIAGVVYATVGGQPITRSWYDKVLTVQRSEITAEIAYFQQHPQGAKLLVKGLKHQLQTLPKSIFQSLIDNLVIEQRGHAVGAKTSPAFEVEYINAYIANQYHGSVANFISGAHGRGMTIDQYKQYLLMLHYNVGALTAAFHKHVPKTAALAHVRSILLALRKPARGSYTSSASFHRAFVTYALRLPRLRSRADSIAEQLRHGGSWNILALKYSDDPSRTHGGDLGWQPPFNFAAPFAHVASTARLNRVTVVNSIYGFHVIQVLGRRNGKLTKSQMTLRAQALAQNWLHEQESLAGYVVVSKKVPAR